MPINIKITDHLILRSLANETDRKRYAAFNAAYNNPSEGATCDCLLHHHPDTTLEDYWVVEDSATGEIVSCTCLLPWNCNFGGIDLRIAQLEMVLTHPDYRGQGLIRAQIRNFEQEVIRRGYDLGLISGIPFYYRQFGYAYSLDMDRREELPVWKIPDPLPRESEPIQLRPANAADIPELVTHYPAAVSDLAIYTRRSAEYWRYLLEAAQYPIEIIASVQSGETLGYAIVYRSIQHITILECGLAEADDCLHLLQILKPQAGQRVLVAGSAHSPLARLARGLGSQVVSCYQWLLRIPDLTQFLKRIGPVLDERLAGSPWRRLTADLILNLYRQAYRLRFEAGQLAGVERLGFVDASMGADGGDICIPPAAFVRLVTGYRALDELFDAWPDIVVKPAARGIVEALFPPLKSYLYMPYHFMGPVAGEDKT